MTYQESLRIVIATHVRDWSADKRDAWIYGIVVGWKDAIHEVAKKHGWSPLDIHRLSHLHRDFLDGVH